MFRALMLPGAVAVNVSAQSINASGVGTLALAGYGVENTGKLFLREQIDGAPPVTYVTGQWMAPPIASRASAFEVMMTQLSGNALGGSGTGAWLSCGTSREWTLSDSGPGTKIAQGRVDFRRAGSLIVVDTAIIDFFASN